MATATVLQPVSTYPPPFSYPSYPPHTSSTGPTMEPRRNPSDHKEALSRQSLPSISEVISKTSTQYPAPPAPQPATQANSSLRSPFSGPLGPLPSHAEAEKHGSPPGPQPGPPFGATQESMPAYGESPRAAFNIRPPVPALPDRRTSLPVKTEYSHPYAHEAQKDARGVNGAYAHPPPPSNSYSSGPLPPGQIPLPAYPPSPRHGPPQHQTYSGYEQRGSSSHVEEGDRVQRHSQFERPIYSAPRSYGEALDRLAQSARTTYHFAKAYGRIASEQHDPQPIPERLPSGQEVADIISNHDMQRAALERIREVIAQTLRSQRGPEPSKPKATCQDEQDAAIFEDGSKTHYNITEVKKRRGRAAPPDRCHSCNRVDTPEWRRGPHGARTLCNACGLYYAKLERKRQLEQRNIRPTPEDRN